MEFHVDFSSLEDVMRCDPKVPLCEYKAGGRDNSQPIQGFKESQEP